jgi:hypothetical protein
VKVLYSGLMEMEVILTRNPEEMINGSTYGNLPRLPLD